MSMPQCSVFDHLQSSLVPSSIFTNSPSHTLTGLHLHYTQGQGQTVGSVVPVAFVAGASASPGAGKVRDLGMKRLEGVCVDS